MDLSVAVLNFLYAYLPVMAQLIVCEALFVFKLKRKRLFAVRLIAGLAVFVALTFLTSCVALLFAGNAVLGAVPYLVMFIISVGVMSVCFDIPFKLLLLYGVAAYSMQNMLYRMTSLFEITGVVWRLFERLNSYAAAYHIVYGGLTVVFAPVIYFLCVRRINTKGAESIYSRNVLCISVVMLIIVLMLCSYTNAWWWQSWYLSIINYCFAILGNMFVLAVISGMFENSGLKSEIATIRQLWMRDKRQYEIAKENMDIINIKCHDLKHKIGALRKGDATDAELKEIENAVAIYDSAVRTGCDPIDVVLTEKSLICTKRNIKLTCMADGGGLSFMSESELYSLFGNMLSNAVNAVSLVADEQSRIISLTVTRNAGLIMINCVNYFSGEIVMNGDLPKTSSGNTHDHGFGMKSMRLLVKKYGGEMEFTAENGIFDLKIVIPVRDEKSATGDAFKAA